MTLAGSEGPRDAVSDISVDVENKIEQEVESSSSSNSNDENDSSDTKERLQELKDLKEDGILTEEEFKEKKKEILDEI